MHALRGLLEVDEKLDLLLVDLTVFEDGRLDEGGLLGIDAVSGQ